MTKFKKIAISLSVIVMLLTLMVTALAVTAEEYTGNVTSLTTLIGNYDKAKSLMAKERALNKALEYTLTIDPEAEGLEEKLLLLDTKELELAGLYLNEIEGMTDASTKYQALVVLGDYVARHPFPETTEGYDAFALNHTNTVVAIAELYLTECENAETAPLKHVALDGIEEVLRVYAPAMSEEFGIKVDNANYACANLYLAAIDPDTLGVAQLGANVRQLRAFLKDHAFAVSEGREYFHVEYTEKLERYEAAYEAQKTLTQNHAYSNDYSSTIRINLPFDEPGIGSLKPENYIVNGEPITYIGEDCHCGFFTNPNGREDHDEDCGNKYYTVRFDKERTHFRTVALVTNITNSMVFECDFTTFDKLPDDLMSFDDLGQAEGVSWDISYFSVAPNGDIVNKRNANEVLVSGAVVPGEWTHFSIVVDYLTNEAKLYVDYELVATSINLESKNGHGYYYSPYMIRIGGTPKTAGSSFSIDNVRLYSGYAPRELDWYNGLPDAEKFIYNVSQLLNEDIPATGRREYHITAGMGLPMFYSNGEYSFDAALPENAKLKEAVDTYNSFELEPLLKEIEDDNLDLLRLWYKKVADIKKGETTIAKRTYWLAQYDSFAGTHSDSVTANDEYFAMVEHIASIRAELSMENQAKTFAAAVQSFYTSAAYSRKVASFEEAQQLYPTIDMSYLAEVELYPSFYEALGKYDSMAEVLYEYTQIENSKRLLACLTFISKYDTEESWIKNFDEINGYVVMARRIIAEGVYDVYYSNLADLLAMFEPMDDFFYEKLQELHIEHIKEQLALYEKSTFYFEQYGILRAIQVYVDGNDIDYDNEELVALIDETAAKLEALTVGDADYDALLVENSRLFVEKCKNLTGSQDYLTMKRALAEASVYFYNMDVADANAQDALAIYIMREKEIRAIEAYVEEFASEVFKLTSDEGDFLENVISAHVYVDNICKDVPGATALIEQYNAKLAEYDADVTAQNNEIFVINSSVAAANNTDGNESIITLVLKALAR